jgi:hypothetical protein
LPKKVTIAGVASGKPNHIVTIHTSKGAPKSSRLDAAGTRKRAASKGDVIVEVKPGEEVTSVVAGWAVERFVKLMKEEKKEKEEVKGKKGKEVKSKKTAKPAKPVKAKKAAKPAKPAKKSAVKKKKK